MQADCSGGLQPLQLAGAVQGGGGTAAAQHCIAVLLHCHPAVLLHCIAAQYCCPAALHCFPALLSCITALLCCCPTLLPCCAAGLGEVGSALPSL